MTTTKPRQTLIPALERLRRLSLLEPDWDSYGGDPPTSTAIGTAKRVIEMLVPQGAGAASQDVEPRVIVARGDGGIIMEWDAPRAALEVHVEPGGTLGYLLDETIDGESRYTERDDASWSEIETLLADVMHRV